MHRWINEEIHRWTNKLMHGWIDNQVCALQRWRREEFVHVCKHLQLGCQGRLSPACCCPCYLFVVSFVTLRVAVFAALLLLPLCYLFALLLYNTIQYKSEYYYSGINPVEFRGHSYYYKI